MKKEDIVSMIAEDVCWIIAAIVLFAVAKHFLS